jgi:hypothetical protein
MDVNDSFLLEVINRIEESEKYKHMKRTDYMSESESKTISQMDQLLQTCRVLKGKIQNAT